MSTSQQVEVHNLLHGSDLITSSSQAYLTSSTSKYAKGREGEAFVLDSDCSKGSILLGTSSVAGGPEMAGARAVLQVPPDPPRDSEAVTGVAEDGAEGAQEEPPAKKLRREGECAVNCNREQVKISEQREEKGEHDSVDDFFISTTQVTALWGMGSDQCDVLEVEEKGEGLTAQNSEWEAFSGSLASVPLCVQQVEEEDIRFTEDSPHSTPPIIDLVKDSVSPNHDSCALTLHGNDECLVRKMTLVSDGGRVREGDGESDYELIVPEDPSVEGIRDDKTGGGVGVTEELEHIQDGHAGKDGKPLQTGEMSCAAELGEFVGKAGIWNGGKSVQEGDTVVIEKGEMGYEKTAEEAMGIQESSGREYTENDSDFLTAPSELEASSPPSTESLLLPSSLASPLGDKGVLQSANTNSPVVVVDLVCEDTTPKTAEGFLDVSLVSDSNKSSVASNLPRSRALEGSEEIQDKFRIIVPTHNELSTHSSPIPEQDTAKSIHVHSQQSQSNMTTLSPSFTLITPDVSLQACQMPHSSLSSDTSLLTNMTPNSSTEEPTQRRRELLTKIKAYWQRQHMESPVNSDVLCHFTALHDQQVQSSSPTARRGRPRKPC